MKKYILISLLMVILFACGKNGGSETEILSEVATKGDLVLLGFIIMIFK